LLTVEVDPVCVESRLVAGAIECPCCVGGVLGGWGHARERVVVGMDQRVRPRRGRCRGCGVTQVLLPVSLLLRRAYTAERIWSALVAKASGVGHRKIAQQVEAPVSTVRDWLRRMGGRLEQARAWFVGAAIGVGVDVAVPQGSGSLWVDALAAVGLVFEQITGRFGEAGLFGAVTAAGVAVTLSGGRLLAPGWPPVMIVGRPTPNRP
jgi:hypothetical protein